MLPHLVRPASPRLPQLNGPYAAFEQTLAAHGEDGLVAASVETLQINVGKLCNQTCSHCHVDAGPARTEIMERDTIDAAIEVLRRHPSIRTVDITGGAPEMNPHFEYLVERCRHLGRHVIDRCNLTVIFMRGKEYLPEFLRDNKVEIVASLPCYLEENVDAQRGKGVYGRSIEALKRLNGLGYGVSGSGLLLNLVFNPLGPKLPPAQSELEADYKVELRRRFGIEFNRLFTITNMPINRFVEDLRRSGEHERYMHLLASNFNLAAARRVMCRNLVSVGWDGVLYDCDFNQMLELPLYPELPRSIKEFDLAALERRRIVTRDHCFGCTAGSGSSCGGAVAPPFA